MASHGRITPQVHQIKAIFEGFRNGRSRSSERSARGRAHHSNLSTDNSATRSNGPERSVVSPQPGIADDLPIDSHLNTHPPASKPARPTLSAKPSWIGPHSHSRTHEQAMARKVTITYEAPGLRPPVYITTSLSEPAWDIIEMSFTRKPHGDLLFYIDFEATEGEYQYKFRLGPGDWWVCDDSKPTIDDGFGNRNNVLFIESDERLGQLSKVDSVHDVAGHALKIGDVSVPKASQRSLHLAIPHEHSSPDVRAPSQPEILIGLPAEAAAAIRNNDESASGDVDTDDDQDDEPAPLLRHETNSPDHHPYGSPVTSPIRPTSSGSSFDDVFCPEADPNDTSLHHFPTHHEGIIDVVKRTHRNLPEDQTGGALEMASPVRKSSSASSPNLPSVSEAHEEILHPDDERYGAKSMVADSSTNGNRWFDHSHAPAHHHSHHRKSSASSAALDEASERAQSTQVKQRSVLDNIQEAALGLGLAVLVAVAAMLLYRSGWLGQQSVVKDGGAVMDV